MRRPSTSPIDPVVILAILAVPLMAGCLGAGNPAVPDPGNDTVAPPSTADTADPPASAPSPPPPTERTATHSTHPPASAPWTVTLHDARAHQWDPPVVRLRIDWTSPPPHDGAAHLAWSLPGDAPTDTIAYSANQSELVHERSFDAEPGPLHIGLTVTLDDASQDATLDLTVWQPLRIIINASETYASDQNVFHEDRLVPFAAYDDESALDALNRMAQRHDFPVKADYREDLDSWFIDEINGTAFRWEEPQILGISRNWMVFLNGNQTQNAVDDTFPQGTDLLEFRYLRCHSTGQCEDP